MAHLITHSGSFHADDVTAYAILRELPQFKAAPLIRTRDNSVFEAASANDVIFDVGMVFDPIQNRFDHHMNKPPLRAELHDGCDIPYSSVGLVWRRFGVEFIKANFKGLSDDAIEDTWTAIDRDFILPIDMVDNGIGEGTNICNFSMLVEDFNSNWMQEQSDEQFKAAADFAFGILMRKISHRVAMQLAIPYAKKTFDVAGADQIAIFEKDVPWKPTLLKGAYDHILFVISNRESAWYVNAVPLTAGAFEMRKPLPEQWAGLEAKELRLVTGVEDAIFCHNKLFICSAATRDGAVRLARLAVAH